MENIKGTEETFEEAKTDDRDRKHLYRHILSSANAEKRAKDYVEWMESVVSAAEQIIYRLREYTALGPSENWSSYLGRLRLAILDEAPTYFRTKFLVNQIREAAEIDNWEAETRGDPGVISLAKELESESAIARQGCGGDNDYARAMAIFIQRVVAGIQEAVKMADPCEIQIRASTLDVVFRVIEYAEASIEDALDPTTPTMVTRLVVEEIGSGTDTQAKDW